MGFGDTDSIPANSSIGEAVLIKLRKTHALPSPIIEAIMFFDAF